MPPIDNESQHSDGAIQVPDVRKNQHGDSLFTRLPFANILLRCENNLVAQISRRTGNGDNSGTDRAQEGAVQSLGNRSPRNCARIVNPARDTQKSLEIRLHDRTGNEKTDTSTKHENFREQQEPDYISQTIEHTKTRQTNRKADVR